MRAHLSGAIDFREARLRDVNWWRRTRTVLRALAAEYQLDMLRAAYAFQCALVANGNLSEGSFQKTQEDARATCHEMLNLLQPWAARSAADVRKQQAEHMLANYKRVVGDPGDPDFQAKIRAAMAAYDARRQQTPGEAAEDLLKRRVADQARERRERRRRR